MKKIKEFLKTILTTAGIVFISLFICLLGLLFAIIPFLILMLVGCKDLFLIVLAELIWFVGIVLFIDDGANGI